MHVYKLSCAEENMSSIVENTHPKLNIRPSTTAEDEVSLRGSGLVSPPGSPRPGDLELNVSDASTGVIDRYPPPIGEINHGGDPFSHLPSDIVARILRYLFVFDNEPVHAISRLDPYAEPQNIQGRVSLLRRFHVGAAPVSITHATKPADLLAPLVVCQKWHFLGANLFYGCNTFAFSSLGE